MFNSDEYRIELKSLGTEEEEMESLLSVCKVVENVVAYYATSGEAAPKLYQTWSDGRSGSVVIAAKKAGWQLTTRWGVKYQFGGDDKTKMVARAVSLAKKEKGNIVFYVERVVTEPVGN